MSFRQNKPQRNLGVYKVRDKALILLIRFGSAVVSFQRTKLDVPWRGRVSGQSWKHL